MAEGYIHSVRFVPSKCKGCVTCVKACPTDAIRVRNGKAELIAARCIDCGECMRRCAYHAVEAYSDKLEEIQNTNIISFCLRLRCMRSFRPIFRRKQYVGA